MPSTFASVVSGVGANAVVCLAAGAYGEWTGGARNNLTVHPVPGLARGLVTMYLDFANASGITVDGMTLTGIDLRFDTTHDLVIRNNNVTGCTSIKTAEWTNANVLLDSNEHLDRNADDCQQDGRISLPNRNENAPSGLTICNSLFSGGDADGILNGSNGTIIEGNTFRDLHQASSAHTDAIQLYGPRTRWFVVTSSTT